MDRGKAAAIHDALSNPDMLVDGSDIYVCNRNRGRDIAIGDKIAAKLLQRGISVGGFIVGVIVDKCGLFIEHCLAQHRADRLAFGKPVAAFLAQDFFGFRLVHGNEPRRPAIGKTLPVQLIENAGQGRRGKPEYT